MSSVGATAGSTGSPAIEYTTPEKHSELGKDDFLKLLSTQLAYQDPLQPVADYSFIAQLAQFSSLEQMYNVNTEIRALGALAMVGMQVTVRNDDGTKTDGTVDAVKMLAETILLTMGDKQYDISQVEEARRGGGGTE